jgi:hypothetical protein
MSHTDPPDPPEEPLPDIPWDIRREGRAWSGDEAFARFELTPEKFEMLYGRLFMSQRERLLLLGLLLENVGMDAALGFGRIETWEEALRARLG